MAFALPAHWRARDDAERAVVRDSLGLGFGVGLYGITFGALGVSVGLSVWQTCLLSLLVFTGASQFAFVGVIAAGGAPIAGAFTSMLLGTRMIFYGISVARRLDVRGWRRLLAAHILIDESTAMGVTRPTARQTRLGFYWTGALIFAVWNVTTLIGAVAGSAVGDPRTVGLDAVVAAAFLALLWPRLDSWSMRAVAVVSVAISLSLVPLTAPGMPIIIGGLAAVVLGMLWTPRGSIDE